jgi:hypothetical protein
VVLVAGAVTGAAIAATNAAQGGKQAQGAVNAAPANPNGTGRMPAPRLRGAAAQNPAAQQAAPGPAAAAQAAAADNQNCTLIVPANPLTAQGLATPYQLTATDPNAGPCHEANTAQSAFVQGAIITQQGQLTLYDPLVIDQGTKPIAAPAAATVAAGSTVALWFGFNATNLTLQAANGTNALTQGNCVNGSNGSIFGQFAACNATAFFQAANAAIGQNMIQVPGIGNAKDGKPCPTVRSFDLVDQDQSDNVTAHYLSSANGQTGQANAATRAALQQMNQNNPADLANGSDNRLLDTFVDPTLGCTPWMQANGAQDGQATSSLPLNELQAAANQAAPIAQVPLNDPMTLVNNNQSQAKTNLFRAAVDQPQIGQGGDNGDGATYCKSLFNNAAGIQRVFNDQATLANGTSPDPAAASNLFTFLAMRGQGSFENLGCGGLLNQANPIKTTLTNGVVTAATFTAGGAAAGGAGAGTTPTTTTAPAATTTTAAAPPTRRRRGPGGQGGPAAPAPAATTTTGP